MRRLVFLCGAMAIGALGASGFLLAATLGRALPPGGVFSVRPIFTLPLPPTPPTPVGAVAANGEVLFVSTRDGAAEIYQMDDSGAGQTRLTSAFGKVADPTQSLSGRLTYSALVGQHWQLVAGSATAAPEQLTHDGGDDLEPRWIGATSTLVYVSDRSGNDDLWTLDTSSGATTDLTQGSPGPDLDPAPSPDGSRIAFASNHGSGFDIYVLALDSGTVTQLTHDGHGNRHPSWSPDGTEIAFDRAGPGGSDIWRMNTDGTHATAVIVTAADEFGPSYAPAPVNGKPRLVYVTNANGNYEVWNANDDGSNAFDMSQSPAGDDISPFWAPAPQGEHIEAIVLQPTAVEGAGGGPNSPRACTITYHGHEPIVGTPVRDVICGSPHADVIRALGGNDVIYPGGGNDTVYGGPGDDVIYARGGGADTIHGGPGLDTAYVDSGDPPPDVEIVEP
jgi:Ca2+-binding RTX toxin-like protein